MIILRTDNGIVIIFFFKSLQLKDKDIPVDEIIGHLVLTLK